MVNLSLVFSVSAGLVVLIMISDRAWAWLWSQVRGHQYCNVVKIVLIELFLAAFPAPI